jgi:hypothetical protein
MAQVAENQGKLVHLDLEPEPDGLLERSDELVRFFAEWLLPVGGQLVAQQLGVSADAAREVLRRHVGVCFDTCHVAVAREDPAEVLDRFDANAIRVGKLQISAGLAIRLPADRSALEQFADPVYLHQVSQHNSDGSLQQYPDLPEALAALDNARAGDWRIHFHTPLFVESYGRFGSTRDTIVTTLDTLRRRRACRVLEIETYTWDVLPPELKLELTDSIAREYEWVLSTLGLRAAALPTRSAG